MISLRKLNTTPTTQKQSIQLKTTQHANSTKLKHNSKTHKTTKKTTNLGATDLTRPTDILFGHAHLCCMGQQIGELQNCSGLKPVHL